MMCVLALVEVCGSQLNVVVIVWRFHYCVLCSVVMHTAGREDKASLFQ